LRRTPGSQKKEKGICPRADCFVLPVFPEAGGKSEEREKEKNTKLCLVAKLFTEEGPGPPGLLEKEGVTVG